MFLLAFVIFVLVGVLIYFKFYKPLQYWKELNVPCSKQWPFSFLFMKTNALDFIIDLYSEFPNLRYNGSYLFFRTCLVIKDLDLIKELTINKFEHFTDHVSIIDAEVDPMIGNGLFFLKGNKWKSLRATLSPAFTSSKMKSMFILMSECAENFTNYFLQKNEEVIEIESKDTFSRYTNDVIASTAFGVKCDSLKEPKNEFFIMGKRLTSFGRLQAVRFLACIIVPSVMKFLRLHVLSSYEEEFFTRIVVDNIKQREEKGIIRPDLIHLLMEAKKGKLKHEQDKDSGAGFATVEESIIGKTESLQVNDFTDAELTAQALLFFFGGFDMSSSICCVAVYELVVNPDIQEKLQEEIDQTLLKCNGKISYEALLKMTYLDQVVSEILRKWTHAFITDRVCVKDYLIEPKNPGEKPLLLEKGKSIVIPIIAIHRNPEYYPNPDKFDPDRFSEENKSKIVSGSYLPFGSGPRNCIGSRFVLLELKIVLFHLLSKFDCVVTKKTIIPLPISKHFHSSPEVGWFGLKPRTNTHL